MSGADVKDTFRTAAEHFNLDDCDVDELLHAVATSASTPNPVAALRVVPYERTSGWS